MPKQKWDYHSPEWKDWEEKKKNKRRTETQTEAEVKNQLNRTPNRLPLLGTSVAWVSGDVMAYGQGVGQIHG